MKNLKLINLCIEWGIRFLALIFGSLLSPFCLILGYQSIFDDNFTKDVSRFYTIDLILIYPILGCIFILVATRKFKELNQLIEENKKL